MKIKLWKGEYEFDKGDAEIVVPLVLVLLGLAFTPLNRIWLLTGAATYYLLYFFLKPSVLGLKEMIVDVHHWWIFRCPYCRSQEMVEQGLQEYKGDVPFYFHICNQCHETSVLMKGRFIKTTRQEMKIPF
jgi:hypothetical protein